jgi:hypothetical protein
MESTRAWRPNATACRVVMDYSVLPHGGLNQSGQSWFPERNTRQIENCAMQKPAGLRSAGFVLSRGLERVSAIGPCVAS